MPIANHQQYCKMLDTAMKDKFAFPAINVSSTSTANATIETPLQDQSRMELFKSPLVVDNSLRAKV